MDADDGTFFGGGNVGLTKKAKDKKPVTSKRVVKFTVMDLQAPELLSWGVKPWRLVHLQIPPQKDKRRNIYIQASNF